ncbi:MAG: hypothetical protein RIT81_46965 [Deltaproteobacteria bacterium]
MAGWKRALVGCLFLSACDGACVQGVGGVPGGFANGELIDRAAQIRATDRGLATVAALLEDEVRRETPTFSIDVCPGCTINGAFDTLALVPITDGVRITMGTQLTSAPISVEVSPNVSCLVSVAGPAELVFDAQLAPRSSSESQLALDVLAASVVVPASTVTLEDTCAASTAALATAIGDAAAAPALGFGRTAVGRLLGQVCDVDADCASGATCRDNHYCVAGERVLLDPLTFDQRIELPSLFASAGYGTSAATNVDTWVGVGGASDADPNGVTLGVQAAARPVSANARCAAPTPSPRARPSFATPPALPSDGVADLDFDGTRETEFDIALGLSRAHLEQLVWSTYQTGVICGRVTERDISDLNTGTLELIIPSLRFLTRGHLFPWSEKPARLSIWLASEPEVALGSGKVADVGAPMLPEDNLVVLTLRDLTIELNVLVEERFVRVATIALDVSLGLGVTVTPDQELVPVIGSGFADLISNVRVTNSELLTDPPASIASAIPTLVQLGLFEILGPQDPIALPSVPGLDTEILGIRSEEAAGVYENVVVYAALAPPGTGNLAERAHTTASIVDVAIPETAAFAVTNVDGPQLPRVTLALDEAYEHQVRVDGGWWSTFTRGAIRVVSEPAFLLQGTHTIEVRSRVPGASATLDPSGVKLHVNIDSEPPVLTAEIVDGGLSISARDRISRDRVRVFVEDETRVVEVVPDADGFVAWSVAPGRLVVRAEDEAGRVAEVQLQASSPVVTSEPASCTTAPGQAPAWIVVLLAAVAWRRRR